MQKNRNIFIYLIMCGIWLSAVFSPSYASAATSSSVPSALPEITWEAPDGTIHVCPAGDHTNDPATADKGFTKRLVPCLRNTIIYATSELIVPLSKYFSVLVAALFTLAVIIWGILVVTGHPRAIMQNGLILALKIGFVIYFTNSFGGYYPILLDSLANILNMMIMPVINGNVITVNHSSGSSALCTIDPNNSANYVFMYLWNVVDCYLDMFIGGIFSKANLSAGIIGFIVGAAFSTSVGMFIAIAGIYMLMMALFTLARAVYIFITSYIAFSFMVLISFLFIPCILFHNTKKYFDGWLQLTVSFFVQPIFLLGYLVMFLVAFNSTVFDGKHSLYYAIAGADSQKADFKLGEWISSKGGYYDTIVGKGDTKINIRGGLKEIGGSNKNFNPAITGTMDIQAQRPNRNMDYDVDSASSATHVLNFFETGVEVLAVNWEPLAIAAKPDAFSKLSTNEEKQKFYLDYKMTVFISFIMVAVFMYLFYSLLSYIPYIGNAALGTGGIPLGVNNLGMPGSNLFAGVGG